MTPDDPPEERGTQHRTTPPSGTTQFGLLRTLIWMSPGFGAAVLWICLSNPRWPTHFPDIHQRAWITGAVLALLVAAFAWLDSLVNPAVEKRDGHPTTRGFWISALWFTGGQVVTVVPVFGVTTILAEMFRL